MSSKNIFPAKILKASVIVGSVLFTLLAGVMLAHAFAGGGGGGGAGGGGAGGGGASTGAGAGGAKGGGGGLFSGTWSSISCSTACGTAASTLTATCNVDTTRGWFGRCVGLAPTLLCGATAACFVPTPPAQSCTVRITYPYGPNDILDSGECNTMPSCGTLSGQVYPLPLPHICRVRMYAAGQPPQCYVGYPACAVPAPALTFSANPTSVASGGTSTLSWTTTDVASCWASNGWSGWVSNTGGSSIQTIPTTTTFTLECWNVGGVSTGQKSATVTVTALIDGGWSPCSTTACGTTGTMTCTNPTPSGGGANCIGPSTCTNPPCCTPNCSAATNYCSGVSFNDGCGGTSCTGTRSCDFNWKEVAP